ncbi:MAG: spore coat U domain-containing protein [Proteobacteria bacterium]|nr:MAG: spore coat U domain-containing protein [Pseudomonadota bacterium]
MNRTPLYNFTALLLIVLGLFFYQSASAAVNCTITATPNTNFGSVNVLSASPADSSATLNYTCSHSSFFKAYSATLCFNIGTSLNGAVNPRQLTSAGNTLNYQLYQDSARSTIWGSQYGAFQPVMVNISLPPAFFGTSSTSGTMTVYGRVPGGQLMVVPGAYNDSFSGGNAQMTINQNSALFNPPPPPGVCGAPIGANFPFTVQANVTPQCFINASPLNFGNVGLLTGGVSANTFLAVQCSRTTAYNVGLGAGLNSGGNINARQMVLGANNISYQLFQDVAQTLVWGDTVGTDTMAGTGAGNTQNLTVYGNVPAQTTPPAGTYSDTIVVTVTY